MAFQESFGSQGSLLVLTVLFQISYHKNMYIWQELLLDVIQLDRGINNNTREPNWNL